MDVRVDQTWNERSTAWVDFPSARASASTHVSGTANCHNATVPERDCVCKGPM
jgi:hypothetical protein